MPVLTRSDSTSSTQIVVLSLPVPVVVGTATSGRSGVYDVMVFDGDGEAVAAFRGLSRVVEGRLVPPLPEETRP